MNNASDFERRVQAFERAWQECPHPDLRMFLPLASQAKGESGRLLAELVCIDMEFRARQAVSVSDISLAEYIARIPELGPLESLPVELIVEEYRVRQRWGDRPLHSTIVSRFPAIRRDEIVKALFEVDRELNLEQQTVVIPSVPISKPSGSHAVGNDASSPMAYGDFKLQRLIGAGRVGRVYLALQQSLNRQVAVKHLRKAFLTRPDAVAQFAREARIISQLSHPGLIGVHGLGRTPGGGYFIVMDLMAGGDLDGMVRRGYVAIADAVRWTIQACEAIGFAHERGIVHCDLKPANLLLDAEGNVRVADFGMARTLAADDPADSTIAGTAPFMAPEQVLRSWGTIGTHTDVYGLGAVLYTLLVGHPPSQGHRLSDVLSRVASRATVDSPLVDRPELPPQLVAICMRSLEKQATARFLSAAELCSNLRRFVSNDQD